MTYGEDLSKYKYEKIKKDTILLIFTSYSRSINKRSRYITNLLYKSISQNTHIFEKMSLDIDNFVQYLIDDGFYAIYNPYEPDSHLFFKGYKSRVLMNQKYGVNFDILSVSNKFCDQLTNNILEFIRNRTLLFKLTKFYIRHNIKKIILNELLFRFMKRGIRSPYMNPPHQGSSKR